MKLCGILCASAVLALVGCSPQSTAESPPPVEPAAATTGKTSNSPYTREYYQKMGELSAAGLKEHVRVGMGRTEVTDVLGRATSIAVSPKGEGKIEFSRSDGVLVVQLKKDKVSGTELRKH